MEENIQTEDQLHLFDSEIQCTEASQGSRFFNFLIDNIFMSFGLSMITSYAVGYLLAIIAPEFTLQLIEEGETGTKMILVQFCIAYFNYFFYYTICEAAFKGYTLGKLITGSRAVRLDGSNLTFKDAVLRSLSRMVPFEVFSGLGSPCNPWHDTWTKTWVIKAR